MTQQPMSDLESSLARAIELVEDLAPERNPFVEFRGEAALAEAQARRGDLDGLPLPISIGVKDVIGVAGTRMRAGSRVYDRDVTEDAAAVALLRSQGAIVLGTTRAHELALGPTGLNPHDGGCRHPLDSDRISGGSSSGSAVAVARGMCPIALGTDTGGSVRIPAALCGVVGYKPTFGAIPIFGVLPVSLAFDHIGVFGRSVSDVRSASKALMAGHHSSPDRDRSGIIRIGVLEDDIVNADDTVRGLFESLIPALSGMDVVLEPVVLSDSIPIIEVSSTILFYEASRVHADILEHKASELSPLVLERLTDGSRITPQAYREALAGRQAILRQVEETFQNVDLLINPTVPIVAPLVEEAADPATVGNLVRHTRLANVIGNPTISVPVPSPSLPVGLQIMAGRGHDALLLSVAQEIEEMMGTRP